MAGALPQGNWELQEKTMLSAAVRSRMSDGTGCLSSSDIRHCECKMSRRYFSSALGLNNSLTVVLLG
jgi:hypothetical protein